MRISIVFALAAAALLSASPLRADTIDACVQAAEEGQSLRDRGKLVAARDRFAACSRAECPRVVRVDCGAWLTGVEARAPKVILRAEDAAGRDLGDVKIAIDGAAPEAISAVPRALDPGAHHIRFTRASGAFVDEMVTLREGEPQRAVVARFVDPITPVAPIAPVPRASSRGPVVAAIALGGVALVGGGVFAGLAASAKSDVARLRESCAPGCKAAEVDAVRAKLVGANVALGVGIASAVAAAVILIARPSDPPRMARGVVLEF